MIRTITLTALLLNCLVAGAQLTNTTTLFIGDNVLVAVNGTFSSSQFFMNRGRVLLDGNWNNTGIYQGSGAIELMNTTPKIFSHNGNPVSVLRVKGGGRISQAGNVIISGTMDFESGIWKTSLSDTLLISLTAHVEGGNEDSFVDGPLHHGGNGYAFFPVGLGNQYLPIILQDVVGAAPLIRVEAHADLPGISTDENTGIIYTDYYWEVDAYRNAFAGSPVSVAIPPNPLDNSRLSLLYSTDLSGTNFSFLPTHLQALGSLTRIDAESSSGPGYYITAEHATSVRDKVAFYFPNTLSPEALEEENRYLRVYGELEADDFRLMIFNRIGGVVFDTSDLDQMQHTGWDGRSNGSLVPQGNYPYMLRAVTKLGRVIQQKGMISVIR